MLDHRHDDNATSAVDGINQLFHSVPMRTITRSLTCSFLVVTAAIALAACETPPSPLAARCVDGPGWAAGAPAFRERTDEAGLRGVEGQRLSAVDLDLDGDADLVVRRTGAGPNDLSKPLAERSAWILLNVSDEGGIKFLDVSERSGFFATRNGGASGRPGDVVAFADVDNDGDLDAYAGVNSADGLSFGETSEILLNQVAQTGELTFILGDGGDLRREGQPDLPASAVFFDADRDGDVDLFVPEHNYGENFDFVGDRLYDNDGSGAFSDVHEQRGLVSSEWTSIEALNAGVAHTRSWSGAACDLDGDGDMELLAGSYGRSPNHLWHPQRDDSASPPRYQNVSVASGYAYDDDRGFTDNQMYACFCQAPDAASEQCPDAVEPLIVCDGAGWDPATDEQPFRLGGNNATVLCADLDGDADLDLVTTTIKHWWAGSGSDASEILRNDSTPGAPHFTRPGRQATGLLIEPQGVSWDEGIMSGGTFDFDNDGRIDIYLGASDYPGNRGLLFHNDSKDGALAFSPVATDDFFEHNRSHGIALADFDGDGDIDAVTGHSRSRCDANAPNDCYASANVRLFENTRGNDGNWLQLALVGSGIAGGANRAAIGARVTVTTANGLSQTQEVGGGFGHFGAQNDTTLHFGLGASCAAEVSIRWPDATLSTQHAELVAGYRFRVLQGDEPEPL